MALFGNKRKRGENLKTLSEKEIQDKLYGGFRPVHESKGNPPEPAKPVADSVSVQPPLVESVDLFKMSSADPKASGSSNLPPITARDQKREKKEREEFQSRFSEWADEDDATLRKRHPSHEPKRIFSREKTFRPHFAERIGKSFRGFLQRIGNFDSQMRRITTWSAALGALVLLLAGIHVLNVQREAAMKRPQKKPLTIAEPQPVKTAVQAHEAAPIPAAVPTAARAASHGSKRKGSSSAAAPQAPPPPEESKPALEGYTLQVATYATEGDAQRLVARFQQEKFPSYVKALSRGGGKVYYCVFIGPFKDYSQSESQLEAFKKKGISKPFQDAFIRSAA